MKITLISSNGDIGHKFIQNGVINLFGECCATLIPVEYVVVNKHAPLYSNNYFSSITKTILESDLIVIAGGPIIWPFVERSDWGNCLISVFNEAHKRKIPICAISIGSCYGYEQRNKLMNVRKEELDFIKTLLKYCSLIITRDKIIGQILDDLSIKNTLLPCIAYYSTYKGKNNQKGDKIIFNYMRGGGHHDYLNVISNTQWHTLSKKLILELSGNHQVEFLCHSVAEFELTTSILPDLSSNLIINRQDFLSAVNEANIGICNRIHAGIAMAGLQIPSLTIGTDSRILALEEFGLPVLRLPIAKYDTLISGVESIITNRSFYSNFLQKKLFEVTGIYKNLISKFLNEHYGNS